MPAERAGYTVTMFLVDRSPSMGTLRTVDLPPGPNGEERSTTITNLEWSLQYVKLKIQEMIFNGRKTDQCGVITFGSEVTKNIINETNSGYDHVEEYISIGQPNAATLAKLDALEPSSLSGDPIDALIVGVETQAHYLATKKTWTRKIVLITDGESPIEVEDWEATVEKMDSLNVSLTVVGIDFDDPNFPREEQNRTVIKRANEKFYETITTALKNGVVGTCAYVLQEIAKPDIRQTRSALMGNILRIGDVDTCGHEAIEINIKTSKCTALARPKSWKKFALREVSEDGMDIDEDDDNEEKKVVYSQLKIRTEYYVDRNAGEDQDGDTKMKGEDEDDALLLDEGEESLKKKEKEENLEKVEREDLIRGFKYGTTYAPCPDGQFLKLPTKKGIDICGFFPQSNFRRELSMGEIQYIWADPSSPRQQVILSSIVQAMVIGNSQGQLMAIARWVSRDDMDPKMGVLLPCRFPNVDCLLWAPMPFADDVRKYTFASLINLVSKKGEVIYEHPYIPTKKQQVAMDDFVDAMDLMTAGEKDEEGNRMPWYDTRLSYNPTVHRTKQALFHCAVVSDLATNPLPPPHPDLLKYLDPPKKVIKRARTPLEECKNVFKVKQVPKRVAKARKDGHVHAVDKQDSVLLLDLEGPAPARTRSTRHTNATASSSRLMEKSKPVGNDSDTEEDEGEELLLDEKISNTPTPQNEGRNVPFPTPTRSVSPQVDLGRAPGRIIGTTHPLKDFKDNLAQGDVVSKAVEDMGTVIIEVVMRPFTSRRTHELLECMKAMRQTGLEEEEVDAWNSFVRELKDKCLSKPGNPSFWSEVQKLGTSLSLISEQEAKKQGGMSQITEKTAEEFIAS